MATKKTTKRPAQKRASRARACAPAPAPTPAPATQPPLEPASQAARLIAELAELGITFDSMAVVVDEGQPRRRRRRRRRYDCRCRCCDSRRRRLQNELDTVVALLMEARLWIDPVDGAGGALILKTDKVAEAHNYRTLADVAGIKK